ncbi:hypothetical protein [Candidatus Nitrosocosmicus arcticus]|uniref:hypothetical protein n=1 Tax=Candidatus Nitrosocosmicus arcticus TaxID=2035267 RepID=UPI0011A640E6|nr:hypothetical protein [Candidatus Nitrosocosmicus arcticus]
MTKNVAQVNHNIFSIKKNSFIMKDFEDMTLEEREELLEQIRNLPDESQDPIDVFTHSFNDLSKNWSCALKEFDTIYSECKKGSHVNLIEKKEENG